jgi:hypothetical protein
MCIPELSCMNESLRESPFDLFLSVIRAVSQPYELRCLQEATPFLVDAQWASSVLPSEPFPFFFRPEGMVALVDEATVRLDPLTLLRPGRVLTFILADWGSYGLDAIEPVLARISDRFPEAQCEAIPLHVEGSLVQIILAAGSTGTI